MQRFRFNRMEIAGAFGDIGVLIPLALGLIIVGKMNPTAIFLSAGLFYIFSGFYFRIPMSVQPLKSVTSLAIGLGLGGAEIAMAGLIIGILIPLVSIKQVASIIHKIFTKEIVRGIQMGVGLILIIKGAKLIIPQNGSYTPYLLTAATALIILVFANNRRIPAMLIILVLSAVYLFLNQAPGLVSIHLGPVWPELALPKTANIWQVILLLVLPQLPLTLGNAVVAANDTAHTYFAKDAQRVSLRSLATSIGISNIISSLFQGLPMCHGSGGFTAHFKFGARTGGASIIIGLVLVLVAILLGKTISEIIGLFPLSILGTLLAYVGILHASLLKDIKSDPQQLAVALTIGIIALTTSNLAIAFCIGIALNFIIKLFTKSPSSCTSDT